MPDRARIRLTVRLTLLKLRRSPAAALAAAAVPAFALFIWVRESYGAALKVLLFLLPHVFLIATQDMFKGEVAGGALENVLFVRGGYKNHLLWKNAVLAAAGVAYGGLVFAPFWAAGLISQGAGSGDMSGLFASLLAGIYYVGLGGLLGHFFEGGSNVLIVIVAQAAAFIGLILDAAGGHGFLESLAAGTFRGPGEQLKFVALAAVIPNIAASGALRRCTPWVAALAVIAFLLQALVIRRTELGR